MKFPVSFTLLFFILSCSQTSNKGKIAARDPLKEITSLVRCEDDTNQQYVIFKPSDFPGQKKWPVIICFDPHGQGVLPVELLKSFAGNYGYLLAGSMNIRNGLADIDHAVGTFIGDIRKRYPVDPERIYLVGFSGGGRIALSLGLSSPGFRGIITCSAGVPGIRPEGLNGKPDIFALAGDGDFNYSEVEQLPQQLSKSELRVFVRIYHGTHAWPSMSEMEKAMQWMHLNAMRKELIDTDDDFVDLCKKQILDSAEILKSRKETLEALKLYRLGRSMMENLSSVKVFLRAEEELLTSAEYQDYKKEVSRISLMEKAAREEFARAMTEKDTSWWQKEVTALNIRRNSGESSIHTSMYNRLFGFISIMAYTYTSRSIQAGDLKQAKKIVEIYGIIDPENPDYLAFKDSLQFK